MLKMLKKCFFRPKMRPVMPFFSKAPILPDDPFDVRLAQVWCVQAVADLA
jgi:hypothetical protein